MKRVPPLVIASIALVYLLEATSFDAGFIADPIGPRAFPYVIGVLTLAVCAVLLKSGAAPTPSSEVLPDAAFGLRAATLALALSGYAWVLPYVGFVLATTLLMTLLVLIFRGPFVTGLVGAFLVSAFVYVLFAYAFSIPLPFGSIFGDA